jgi:hypothetical protein
MDLRGPTEAEQEQMLALDLGQRKGPRDPVEYVRRGAPAAPLLQPSIPSGADVGALRHLLAAQSRGSPPAAGEAERSGVELGAPVLEIGTQRIDVGHCRDPVRNYTGIMSLL